MECKHNKLLRDALRECYVCADCSEHLFVHNPTTPTLRDHLAMAALNALLVLRATPELDSLPPFELRKAVAQGAYQWADAMLEARK